MVSPPRRGSIKERKKREDGGGEIGRVCVCMCLRGWVGRERGMSKEGESSVHGLGDKI